ncbi:DUF3775 domain-containing protein [Rhodoblastus acidophilus]|uniref:DUF3775 domain-containing protein n=1 Tax=Candidatus Rhodoblastus alkanivorans TaxID=2954117 RepID=A0ABS9Z951_9HYPH|nr:DUF3775 domain-containing protein [Candidatus Rhodoblastus alkanivorans]MCI4678903.1 DUF3775 domain-containing protein [Candidatus Rhodoblastus alkanivorans]MCI4684173.1 DUF3775 domain-containing protein [Candidatus Rhodoblastus alkanivorans]MDI4641494.1 DUF3775 domain-containing protein [Rhodoblastus acidophilus]
MRIIDDTNPAMPEINPSKVCFIAAKARELLSEDEGSRPDASNATDDGERSILTDAAYGPVHAELVQFIADLDDDEAAALVALMWIGRGDFESTDWEDAVAQARDRRQTPTAQYLLGEPLLPDYLEDALAAYGHSCRDFDQGPDADV